MSNQDPDPHTAQTLLELLHSGRHAECEQAATALTERYPQFGLPWKVLGIALQWQGRRAQAFPALYRAAELLPFDPEAQGNLGLALLDAEEAAAALRFLQRALELNPEDANAWNNLGHGLCRLGRLDEAESHQRQALALRTDAPEFQYNLGSILHDLGRVEEAISWYDQALALSPLFAHAHWSLGMARLQLGDFAAGWKEYEWRWRVPSFMALRGTYQGIRWTGEQDVRGKTLLLYAEQGLGDTLQFCRYAKPLASQGVRVILHVPAPLVRLLQTLPGVAEVHDQAKEIPPHNFCCPMMSLPLACDRYAASVPVTTPYLFAAPALARQWQQRLGPRGLPRVGICWSGNRSHKHDYRRSIALEQFLAITITACEFVVVQANVSIEEAKQLDSLAQCRRFDGQLNDFADTAALIAQLDVVIAVDTAVAHLAAAMGKPTWLLLSANADWRWLEARADSPWYPSMRLFRQTEAGDWVSVLENVRQQLQLELTKSPQASA